MNPIDYFNKNGELKINNLISFSEINKLKKEYKLYTSKNLKKLKLGRDFNFSKTQNIPSSLHRLEKNKNSFFYQLTKKKKIQNLAKKLIGSEIKLYSIQFFLKNFKENHPTPLHQDNEYWNYKNGRGLSFWITLNNTNKKKGVLYYLQKSHNKIFKHVSSKVPGSSKIIKNISNKYKKKYYSLNAGDCVAHDSKCVHGSFKNKSKSDRIAYIISFVSKNSRKDLNKRNIYEKNLKKINAKRLN
ncbi:phytanoyl-CoA dioxygenase family protein [Candidatus Pelagibacter sp. HIMB1782]|uniref:phytanoyl-CoA dioxygenase family protein n=1 Tax=Candidatus Pelagibacter sp. HIMB1782 TaxID=3413375 RepID=UPI003F877CFD